MLVSDNQLRREIKRLESGFWEPASFLSWLYANEVQPQDIVRVRVQPPRRPVWSVVWHAITLLFSILGFVAVIAIGIYFGWR